MLKLTKLQPTIQVSTAENPEDGAFFSSSASFWYLNSDLETCVEDDQYPQWLEQENVFVTQEECCKKHSQSQNGDDDLCMIRACPNGGIGWMASASDCKSYFMCAHGARVSPVYDCKVGLLFSEDQNKCVSGAVANCDRQEGDTIPQKQGSQPSKQPNPSPTLAPRQTQLPTSTQKLPQDAADDKRACPSKKIGWTASSDCRSYFMCEHGTRASPVYECKEGSSFSEEENQCVRGEVTNCDPRDGVVGATAVEGSRLPTARPGRSADSPDQKDAQWFGVSTQKRDTDG